MGWSLPPGMTLCPGPSGYRQIPEEECPRPQPGSPGSESPSTPPNYVGQAPNLNFNDDESGSNLYHDENNVLRNRNESGGGSAPNSGPQPMGGGASFTPSGGGLGSDYYPAWDSNGGSAASSGGGNSGFSSGGGFSGGGFSFGNSYNGGGPSSIASRSSSTSNAPAGGGVKVAYDPNLLAAAQGNAQGLTNTANTVSGMGGPNVGPAPRTLYDKYSNLMQDPSQIANDPAYQMMLQQATQASQRTMAAGRNSKGGTAAIQAAKVAAGVPQQFLGNLAGIYGQSAQIEGNRYAQEAGAQSQGYRDLLAKYQLQGSQYGSAAGLNTAISGATGETNAATAATAQINQDQLKKDILAAMNSGNYGVSGQLSQQYYDQTGNPFSYNTNMSGGIWSGIGGSAQPRATYY